MPDAARATPASGQCADIREAAWCALLPTVVAAALRGRSTGATVYLPWTGVANQWM